MPFRAEDDSVAQHHLNRIKTFGEDAQLALHGAGGSLWAIPSS